MMSHKTSKKQNSSSPYAEMQTQLYYVYILRCSDDSYYIGQTEDLESRLAKHQSGQGPSYTANRLPVKLIYQETFPQRAEAMSREKQLKRWSKAKKQALIDNDSEALHRLAKRRRF